jgi:MarR family transcriptional regulator, transcriptional regulator for hemolysin
MTPTARIGAPPRGGPPIGMIVAQAGKALDRAFDDALSAAGGSRPTWLILLAVKTGAGGAQASIATRVGISGPTLVHHLDRLEASGLISRLRDPANRRQQAISLTPGGEAMFDQLREAAVAFDQRLRAGVRADELATLRRVLPLMQRNVTTTPATAEASS